MDIECIDCHKALGNILAGSKLHKSKVFLCTECYEAYKTYKTLADTKYNTSTPYMPPGFEDIFKMK